MQNRDERSKRRSTSHGVGLAMITLSGALALAACGSDDPGGDGQAPAPPSGGDGGAAATFDMEGCVVSVLATDCSSGLPAPHEIELLNAKTGEPLPGFRTTSAPGGKYGFKNVPRDVEIAIHAIGNGPASEGNSTYDSIAFYVPNTGDDLLRVSSVGTAGLAGMTAAFTPADDKVVLSGAVYQTNDQGLRIGTVGCAQIFVDDQPHPATSLDQRYNASTGIPTRIEKLQSTLAGSGRFYFGNLTTGQHTFKVSMDGGKTFILERSVFLSKARKDADSPFKSLLYLVGLDLKGTNPTPANCPTEEPQ